MPSSTRVGRTPPATRTETGLPRARVTLSRWPGASAVTRLSRVLPQAAFGVEPQLFRESPASLQPPHQILDSPQLSDYMN